MYKILVLISVVALCGCSIDNSQIQQAQKKCKNNEGVKLIYLDMTQVKVICNNDMKAELK